MPMELPGRLRATTMLTLQQKKVCESEDAYSRPQAHACFIQSVSDDLVNEGGIFDLAIREARVFKFGSGSGTNYSNLRSSGEKLSGGGSSSGLMSFLKIFDSSAGCNKVGRYHPQGSQDGHYRH